MFFNFATLTFDLILTGGWGLVMDCGPSLVTVLWAVLRFTVQSHRITDYSIPIQKKTFRIDFPKRINFFLFDSAHHCRIGYYRLLCCQMSTLLRHHESLSQLHKYVGYNNDYAMAIIIDQANAAAKSNGRFLTKRINSPKTNRRIDSKHES